MSGRGNAVARDQHICLVHGASAAKCHPAEVQCPPKVYSKSGTEIVHTHWNTGASYFDISFVQKCYQHVRYQENCRPQSEQPHLSRDWRKLFQVRFSVRPKNRDKVRTSYSLVPRPSACEWMGRSWDEANYLALYLDFLVNAKAHAEKQPSVPREAWLLALRARVLLVANLPVALLYE